MAPATVGSVLGEVVDDGDPPGSSGSSWGGSNRRRASAVVTGSGVAIGQRYWAMSMGEGLRRSREERGVRWCEEINGRGSPFIGEGGYRGAVARSTTARALRRAIELGEGGVLFSVSRRPSVRR